MREMGDLAINCNKFEVWIVKDRSQKVVGGFCFRGADNLTRSGVPVVTAVLSCLGGIA